MKIKAIGILCVFLIIISGCATKKAETNIPTADYHKEMEEYKKMLEGKQSTPSLWMSTGNNGKLFLDYKGRQVGDIIVVKIVENSSASNSNTTSTTKSTNYDAGITNLMGLPLNLGMSNFLGSGHDFDPTIKASTKNSFSGQGKKSKSDVVTATVATRVIGLLPSGNMVIQGSREIIVDQEKQIISIKGIIRQKDVDADNSVLSTKIADAQIRYSGAGVITDANKKGWMSNIIDWVWPF
jgi:flagellar L-ring protein precursor FlgH